MRCSSVVIICSFYYFLDGVLFHHDFRHDSCDYCWDFYDQAFHFELCVLGFLQLSSSDSGNVQLPGCWMDIRLEYWIEDVPSGLHYVMFTFPSRIYYMGVPGVATGQIVAIGLGESQADRNHWWQYTTGWLSFDSSDIVGNVLTHITGRRHNEPGIGTTQVGSCSRSFQGWLLGTQDGCGRARHSNSSKLSEHTTD